MTAQIGCPCRDELVGKLRDHHKYQREIGEKAAGKVDVRYTYIEMAEHEQPSQKKQKKGGIDRNGLPEGVVEEMIQPGVLFLLNQTRVNGNFCGGPVVGESLYSGQDSERHAHLSCGGRPVGCENDGVEQLENEVSANPAYRYFPLKREYLLEIRDMGSDAGTEDIPHDFSERGEEKEAERHDDVCDVSNTQGIEFRSQGKTDQDTE